MNDFLAAPSVSKLNPRRPAPNDFAAAPSVSKLNPRRPAPQPGSPRSERVSDFVATAGGPKLTLRGPTPGPGSPHSKKLRPSLSHLSVISIAVPARKYRLSTRSGKAIPPRNEEFQLRSLAPFFPESNPRGPAPGPGSPHSKKLRFLLSHLSVISFAAPARKYRLSTRSGKTILPGTKSLNRSFAFSPQLNPRGPAPGPGSPHSKKLRLLPSHLSVISSVASARKYPLSTRLGNSTIFKQPALATRPLSRSLHPRRKSN